MVGIPATVKKLELVGLQVRHIDRVAGPESVLDSHPTLELPKLGLHHRAEVARCVVVKLNDPARLTLKHDGHPTPDLGCGNRHGC